MKNKKDDKEKVIKDVDLSKYNPIVSSILNRLEKLLPQYHLNGEKNIWMTSDYHIYELRNNNKLLKYDLPNGLINASFEMLNFHPESDHRCHRQEQQVSSRNVPAAAHE